MKTKDKHDYQMYEKYRNQLKNACQKAVADYEKFLSRDVKSNLKVFFRYAKNKFKNAIPDLFQINAISDNGKIISDDNGKAKAFKICFSKVFLQINQISFQILI